MESSRSWSGRPEESPKSPKISRQVSLARRRCASKTAIFTKTFTPRVCTGTFASSAAYPSAKSSDFENRDSHMPRSATRAAENQGHRCRRGRMSVAFRAHRRAGDRWRLGDNQRHARPPCLSWWIRGRSVGFRWEGMCFRFGDCVLDAETHELLREGRAVRLCPKAFQLLSVVIAERPQALSRDDIHGVLWPKTFVAATTLTSLVKELRAAIGDDADAPRYIRTVPSFGYAFSGEAREVRRRPPAGFFCRLIGPDSEVGLSEGDNPLGRGPD